MQNCISATWEKINTVNDSSYYSWKVVASFWAGSNAPLWNHNFVHWDQISFLMPCASISWRPLTGGKSVIKRKTWSFSPVSSREQDFSYLFRSSFKEDKSLKYNSFLKGSRLSNIVLNGAHFRTVSDQKLVLRPSHKRQYFSKLRFTKRKRCVLCQNPSGKSHQSPQDSKTAWNFNKTGPHMGQRYLRWTQINQGKLRGP